MPAHHIRHPVPKCAGAHLGVDGVNVGGYCIQKGANYAHCAFIMSLCPLDSRLSSWNTHQIHQKCGLFRVLYIPSTSVLP